MACQSWKWTIEKELDDLNRLEMATQQHVQNCQHCRAYYHRLLQLNTALKSSSSQSLTKTQLDNLIDAGMEAVDGLPRRNVKVFSLGAFRRGLWTAGCAAVVLLVAGIWIVQRSESRRNHSTVIDLQTSFHALLFEQSLPMLASLPEKSIQLEMQRLVRDTQRASDFLVGLVPVNPAATGSSQAQINETLQGNSPPHENQ